MTCHRKPIPVEEAIQRVVTHCSTLESETIPLNEAYGRILAKPIIAKHNVPPFDRSAYDGYAIRAADSVGASPDKPISFRVLQTIGAGHIAERPLAKNEAYRIMTGAILPIHADTVVMLEETKRTEQGFTIEQPYKQGEKIFFKGEDAVKGEELIKVGSIIHPGTVALLATFGYAQVELAKRPTVSLITTGTELLSVDERLQPGKIRDSNGPMLRTQLARMGIEPVLLSSLEDNLEAATASIVRALELSDIVITTGGVSVGDFDYLPEIYRRLGAKVLFNKVMMRPGSVTTVAVLGEKMLFGLSGNPSACFTGFELFTRPALLSMMGSSAPYAPRMTAVLGEIISGGNPFTRFVRAIWRQEGDELVVVPAGFNKTSAVSSIARGNCIIILPASSGGYRVGTKVDILLLGQEQGVESWEGL